jgi:transcription initiation factor IIE alpha subunit
MENKALVKARCDSCDNDFEIENKTESIGETVEKNYFTCSHCDKEYVSYYMDQNIRKKQSDLKMLWRNIRSSTTPKNYNKLQKKIEELQDEIKKDLRQLRETITAKESGVES